MWLPPALTAGSHASLRSATPLTELFALYQGTTLVVPPAAQNGQGFSPCHRKIQTKFEGKNAGAKPESFAPLRHD